MEAPNISWFIKENNESYSSYTEYFAGSCLPNKDFIIDLEVWNNRWNAEQDVEDIANGKLEISFTNAEDSVLLSLCRIKIDNGIYQNLNNSEFNRGLISIGNLSGKANTGTYDNINNYKKITIKFSNVPGNFKDGFKTMLLNIIH